MVGDWFHIWSVIGGLVGGLVGGFYGQCGRWSVVDVLRVFWSVVGFYVWKWSVVGVLISIWSVVGGSWSVVDGRWFCTAPANVYGYDSNCKRHLKNTSVLAAQKTADYRPEVFLHHSKQYMF